MMSKVEDLSRRYVLPFLDKQYEKYGKHEQMKLSRFDGYDMMSAYEEGYYKAEKDLEITIDDIMKLDALLIEMWNTPSNEDKYQEVLKRFLKERKGE